MYPCQITTPTSILTTKWSTRLLLHHLAHPARQQSAEMELIALVIAEVELVLIMEELQIGYKYLSKKIKKERFVARSFYLPITISFLVPAATMR